MNKDICKVITLLFTLLLINCDLTSNKSEVTGNIYLINNTTINITYETKPSGWGYSDTDISTGSVEAQKDDNLSLKGECSEWLLICYYLDELLDYKYVKPNDSLELVENSSKYNLLDLN